MNCKTGETIEEQISSLREYVRVAEKIGSYRRAVDLKRSLMEFERLDREHKSSCDECRVEEVA